MDTPDRPDHSPGCCPSCGSRLDPGAGNLCPRCLMARAMQPTAADEGVDPGAAAPSLEEVAAAFPDLEILALIGRGGMGAVYKARQKSLDRLVALKILPRSLAADARFSSYFESEAKALAALSHPNIVTIHDFGHAGGFYFLLMEYVDGVNLRGLLRARRLAPEEALAIVPPLCEALQFAHDRGIVHRDIKPENLLLDRDGRVKVADFGIAKIVGKGEGEAGASLGTPAYMSPEQREAPDLVDSRADIYSLGVVLYEMLTGERPEGAIQPPSGKVAIDVRLDEVVLRALQDEPELRWQTAAELGTRVQTIVSGQVEGVNKAGSESDDWRVTCMTCGNSRSYAEIGGVRVGAHSVGKRLLVRCGTCGRMRKAIVHRSNSSPISPEAARSRVTSVIGFWSLSSLLSSALLAIVSIFLFRFTGHLARSGWLVAIFALQVVSFLVGIVLGWVWLRRLRGLPRSRAAQAFALTILSVFLPFGFAIAASVGVFWIQRDAHHDHVAREQQRVAEMASLHQRLNGISQAIADAHDRGAEDGEIIELEAQAAELEGQVSALSRQRIAHPDGVGTPAIWLSLAVPLLFVLPIGGAGAVLGWRHLAWLRHEAEPRAGAIQAMIAALFWPVLVSAVIVFLLVLLPMNHGRSANLGVSLGIAAALAVSVWMIRSTWIWVKNQPGAHGSSTRAMIGACLIGAGLLISINWLVDLSQTQRHRSELRQRQLVTLFQQRSAAESRKFSAEAEIDGIEVNEINAGSEAERQQFQRDKQAPMRNIERARSELERIDFELMTLRAAQMQDDHWWGRAMVPILVGLALVIPGILLISERTSRRASIE